MVDKFSQSLCRQLNHLVRGTRPRQSLLFEPNGKRILLQHLIERDYGEWCLLECYVVWLL
jgi:hypothetical protein